MSTDLVRAARAEEQRLLRELEATPLYRRLEAVRALLAEYDARSAVAASSLVAAPASLGTPRLSAHRAGGMTARVIAATAEYLRAERRRAQSAEILEAVRRRGIPITGQKPTAVVASILSNCDLFDNVRGQGYGLVEWNQGRASPDPNGPAGGGESELGEQNQQGDPARASGHESGLDSDPDLLSNGNWATDDDRSRPSQDHTI